MKKILITGLNGYIGNRLVEWINQTRPSNVVEKISLKDDNWLALDFSEYDVIVHLVGIAHRKESKNNQHLYYDVNRDLTIKLANKAKEDGVTHFIFISTMSVFGKDKGIIDFNTHLEPYSHYGKSKYEAEIALREIMGINFKVSILRPPMVYGSKSTGNYSKLSALVRKISFFPNVSNQRSMISIQNLNEFILLLIENPQSGNFHPQNKEYVSTKKLVLEIARNNQKKVYLIPNSLGMFNLLANRFKIFGKILGDLIYSPEMSELLDNQGVLLEYNVINFAESIEEAENEK